MNLYQENIDWLLNNDTPEIRYRTMVELQRCDQNEVEVQKAYQELLHSDALKHVMDKFKMKDKWEWINALLTLTEFGLTRKDVAIDQYVEELIKSLSAKMKCARILLLRNLVALGYLDHPWVKEQINQAFSTVREDGTVRCLDKRKKRNDSRLPEMGCYRQTTTYLLLAAELKKINIELPQFESLISFYRKHDVLFHEENQEKVIVKEMSGTFFPIDHVHIGLHVILYALSILDTSKKIEYQKAWAILQRLRTEGGRYRLSDSFKIPYFDVGEIGEPNKWVTLYILLSKNNWRENNGDQV